MAGRSIGGSIIWFVFFSLPRYPYNVILLGLNRTLGKYRFAMAYFKAATWINRKINRRNKWQMSWQILEQVILAKCIDIHRRYLRPNMVFSPEIFLAMEFGKLSSLKAQKLIHVQKHHLNFSGHHVTSKVFQVPALKASNKNSIVIQCEC